MRSLIATACLFVGTGLFTPSAAQRAEGLESALPLAERAEALHALAEERRRHRVWPEENPDAPRSIGNRVPEDFFELEAVETLRMSNALERFWNRPITANQLQAEIDRMARDSRQPDRLAAQWRALNDDPHLVAEVMARSLLAERLLREWYAQDPRFHGPAGEIARRDLDGVSAPVDLLRTNARTAEYELSADRASGSRTRDPAAWTARLESLASRFGVEVDALERGFVSGLREEGTRYLALGVLARGEDRLRILTAEWPKRSFDEWWREVSPSLSTSIETPGVTYRLPAPAGDACDDDTWLPTLSIPEPRYEHTAVWTGSEMIVWGGQSIVGNYAEQGGRYDPATDSWTFVSTLGSPSVRAAHTAVWTGTEMVIWGGAGFGAGNTGGRYDPVTDRWTPTTLAGAPIGRSDHVAVWTGTEMIVWGGNPYVRTGGRYDPATDTWTSTATANAPDGRELTTAVWTGTEMIVWGGFADPFTLDTGGRYDPETDSWRPTTLVGVPSFRHFHSAVWTGEEMIVWGGVGVGFGTRTGGRYDPDTDRWEATAIGGAPSPRWLHEAIWTGDRMIIWGGTVLLSPHPQTGGLYDPLTDSWSSTSVVSAPDGREDSASVWTGSEMIVWGGLGDDDFVSTGGRYDPALDSWVPTQTYNVPTARGLHTATWTGAEMMVYGGNILGEPGGLYDPATDSWRTPSEIDAPFGIQNMTSLWTGDEVIVWGGFPETDEGGRYDPLTDRWTPTTTIGSPGERYGHSAIWTGTEMIVWGGWPVVDTGGRYDPLRDEWTPTTTAGAPSPRDSHAAVWTGGEMIVWGGFPETSTGARYDPTLDSWASTTLIGAPEARLDPSVVWTGTEMIVWGGQSFSPLEVFDSGGRYDPATDSWQPTQLADAPSPRVTPAVWTGSEMIVWGGNLASGDGGRYNPLGDNWVPTTLDGAPSGRWNTTLVWTGEQAIVWGGIIETATGGLYCANLDGNLAPIAREDEYATEMGQPLTVPPPGVLANDTDGNGDPLRARVVEGPENGQLVLRSDGALRYLPDPGFAGTDVFTYAIWDGELASPPTEGSITVSCIRSCLRSVLIVIDLLLDSTRARIFVDDENGNPVANAEVFGRWRTPDGANPQQRAFTNGFGQATLEIPDDSFGTFQMNVIDIVREGFTFDPANSDLVHAATR